MPGSPVPRRNRSVPADHGLGRSGRVHHQHVGGRRVTVRGWRSSHRWGAAADPAAPLGSSSTARRACRCAQTARGSVAPNAGRRPPAASARPPHHRAADARAHAEPTPTPVPHAAEARAPTARPRPTPRTPDPIPKGRITKRRIKPLTRKGISRKRIPRPNINAPTTTSVPTANLTAANLPATNLTATSVSAANLTAADVTAANLATADVTAAADVSAAPTSTPASASVFVEVEAGAGDVGPVGLAAVLPRDAGRAVLLGGDQQVPDSARRVVHAAPAHLDEPSHEPGSVRRRRDDPPRMGLDEAPHEVLERLRPASAAQPTCRRQQRGRHGDVGFAQVGAAPEVPATSPSRRSSVAVRNNCQSRSSGVSVRACPGPPAMSPHPRGEQRAVGGPPAGCGKSSYRRRQFDTAARPNPVSRALSAALTNARRRLPQKPPRRSHRARAGCRSSGARGRRTEGRRAACTGAGLGAPAPDPPAPTTLEPEEPAPDAAAPTTPVSEPEARVVPPGPGPPTPGTATPDSATLDLAPPDPVPPGADVPVVPPGPEAATPGTAAPGPATLDLAAPDPVAPGADVGCAAGAGGGHVGGRRARAGRGGGRRVGCGGGGAVMPGSAALEGPRGLCRGGVAVSADGVGSGSWSVTGAPGARWSAGRRSARRRARGRCRRGRAARPRCCCSLRTG